MKGVTLRYASNEAEADDILQESFIRVFKNLKQYNDQGSLGGWIRTITVNTSLEQYRKSKTRSRHENEMSLEIETEQLDGIFESMALEEILLKIQSLPTGYRIVFNLYAIDGLNHKEISVKLSISEGTSKSQYARAKKALQTMISKDIEYDTKMMRDAK